MSETQVCQEKLITNAAQYDELCNNIPYMESVELS